MYIQLNDQFESLQEFENTLKQYCDLNSIKYRTTKAKTIKSTEKKAYDPSIIDCFRYKYKRYKCNDCDAKLSISLIQNEGVYFLRVISFDSQHNHETEQVVNKRTVIKNKLDQLKNIVSETDEARLKGIETVVSDLLSYLQQNRRFDVSFTLTHSQNGISYAIKSFDISG